MENKVIKNKLSKEFEKQLFKEIESAQLYKYTEEDKKKWERFCFEMVAQAPVWTKDIVVDTKAEQLLFIDKNRKDKDKWDKAKILSRYIF